MRYLDPSRTWRLPAGVRLRVALDILEQAANRPPPRGASAARASVRTLTIGVAGDPIVRQVGTAMQLATLVWEVLALEIADTDEMPFSDPPTDLPEAVGDVLMSLSVRPASSIADLRARTSAVFTAHASGRDAVVSALTVDPSAPARTPVVPSDASPNRVTMPAPAMTVARLRTMSKHDAAAASPPPQVSPMPPAQAARKPPPRFTLAKKTESPRVSASTESSSTAGLDAAREVDELPGAAAALRPAAAHDDASAPRLVRADGAAAGSEPSTLLPAPPAPSRSDAGEGGPRSDAVPASPSRLSPRVSALATSVLAPIESARPSRGTLDPWGESAPLADGAAVRPRRRVWPFVAGAVVVAAAVAIFGWKTTQSTPRDAGVAPRDAHVASAAVTSREPSAAPIETASADPPAADELTPPPVVPASASAVAAPPASAQTPAAPPALANGAPFVARPRPPVGASSTVTSASTPGSAPETVPATAAPADAGSGPPPVSGDKSEPTATSVIPAGGAPSTTEPKPPPLEAPVTPPAK